MAFHPLQLNNMIEDYFLSPEFDMVNNRFPDIKIVRDLDSELPLMDASDIHFRKKVMSLVSKGNCVAV